MTNMNHMKYVPDVAAEDVRELERKEATYQGSWKRRGGVGAFMMMARKWDRLETILSRRPNLDTMDVCQLNQYDVFDYILADPSGDDGSVLAEVRDLRRYLLLIEAEMVSQGVVKIDAEAEPDDVYSVLGQIWGVTRLEAKQRVCSAYNNERPGTPEDGGHHERHLQDRLQDGLPFRADDLPKWPHLVILNPWRGEQFTIVNRRAVFEDPGDTDHLPRLDRELNHKEWSDTAPEYQPMYVWREGPSKWELGKEWREHWGRE